VSTGLAAAVNRTPIIIDPPTGDGQPQHVSAYPSAAAVWGADGPILDVTVDLFGVQQGRPADLDILLESPSGTSVMLASDACTGQVSDATWVFDDTAASAIGSSACSSGRWKPADYLPGETLPATAPRPPYQTKLSAFRGENPNGTWQLFVYDDSSLPAVPQDSGGLLGGFIVYITTATEQIVVPGGGTSQGPASQYPYVIPVSGKVGRIQDVFVYLHDIGHTRLDDLDILLVAPGGQKIMLMSDSCGQFQPPLGRTWRINDRDPAMPDNGDCNIAGAGGGGTNFSPTDNEPGDVLPAPAPPGPYSTSLTSSLYGTDPNGEWKVYIYDDFPAQTGYLSDVTLSFVLGPPADLDTTPPDTMIATHPATATTSRRATFEFAATESPVTFQCRLDGGSWTACSSPVTYRRLSFTRHVFRVRATDEAGNVDPTPAKWIWRVS
jgi:subtilisin-like proprotein convertase family protein